MLRALGPLAIAVAIAGCGGGGSGADPQTATGPPRQPAAAAPTTPPPRDGTERRPGSARADALRWASDLVVFGDSLGASGDQPPYPDLLATLSNRPLQVTNLSQPGSTSADWLPSGALFEDELRGALPGADAVFLSLGGNDLQNAVGGLDGPDALQRAQRDGGAAIEDAFAAIKRNLTRTLGAVKRLAPDATVVYVGYPDYSASRVWLERAGPVATIALRSGLAMLDTIAAQAGADRAVEMLGPTAGQIDSLLADGEHLSAAGHELYARRILALLDAGG